MKYNVRFFAVVPALAAMLLTGNAAWAEKALDFALPDADGKIFRLSDYRGKYVVVDFIMLTCPHCQVAGKVLQKLYEENSKQLMVISISTDFMPGLGLPALSPALRQYAQREGATYPILMGNWEVVGRYLGVNPARPNFHVPVFFFISPSGDIILERNSEHAVDKDWYGAGVPGGDQSMERNLEADVKKILPPEKPAAKARKTGPAKKQPAAKK
jgi:peroxiredoxin